MSLKCEEVINALAAKIPTEGPAMCESVSSIYLFEVSATKGGPSKKWTVDLKNSPGKNLYI